MFDTRISAKCVANDVTHNNGKRLEQDICRPIEPECACVHVCACVLNRCRLLSHFCGHMKVNEKVDTFLIEN